ncbi:MAG: RNA pyrophosphohydrolase [Chloroflexi bacterium]|nr:RNA pyrophosphohydrolase [Chloroflexota bacterium]
MKIILRLLYHLRKIIWRVARPLTVGVRVILIREGTVLLVKHTYQNKWFLPGGGVKKGETVEAAARREAKEEVGATLGDLSLFGVYTNFYHHKNDHIAVFFCEDFTLTGETDWEIEKFDFIPLDELPEDISPGCLGRILEYTEGQKFARVGVW